MKYLFLLSAIWLSGCDTPSTPAAPQRHYFMIRGELTEMMGEDARNNVWNPATCFFHDPPDQGERVDCVVAGHDGINGHPLFKGE